MDSTATTKKPKPKKLTPKSRQQKKKKVKKIVKQKGKKKQQPTTTTTIKKVATTTSSSAIPTPSSSSSSISLSTTLLPLPTTANTNNESINTNTEQNEQDNIQPEEDQVEQQDTNDQRQQISTMAAAAIADSPTTYSTNSSIASHENHIARIAGPIVGIFAGVAFLAVAMFIVVRNRNKRLSTVNNKKDEEDDNNENKFHDIPLNDEDEGIAVMKRMPSLIIHRQQQQEKEEENGLNDKKLSYISTTSTAYHSMSSTLVASRSSSVSTKQKTQQGHESWQSAKSYTDRNSDVFVSSPTSTVMSKRIESFLMTAERQQLQHERPSVLNNFEYHHNKTPIETYKAQLANIIDPEEDLLSFTDNEPLLPFHSLVDINEFY